MKPRAPFSSLCVTLFSLLLSHVAFADDSSEKASSANIKSDTKVPVPADAKAEDAKAKTKTTATPTPEKKEESKEVGKEDEKNSDKDEKADEKKSDEAEEEEKPGDPVAGHSYHGEVFNEGPRQKAYLMGGTGKITFPVSSDVPDVREFVEQGLGQYFGFWYLEAERSFRHAASLDPECAIAYWGAALANLRNDKRAKGFIEEANKRKDKASDREQRYINALSAYIKADKNKKTERNQAYTKALEELMLAYPDDVEAKALLALHMYANRGKGSSYFATNALIEQIFKIEPKHSAHHFRIHLWDYKKPEKALSSAAVCGQGSPAIAHMWHMPGHIYSRLKRYEDACWQQEASARVDHAHMMRDRVMPDEIHNFAHNNEWLIRNLNYVGRVGDAIDLAKNMISLPRHPRYNTLEKRGSTNYGRQRLFGTLRRYELWNDVIAWRDTPYLEPTEKETEKKLKRQRLLGVAYYRTDRVEEGDKILSQVEKRLADEKAKQETAGNEAAEKAKKAKKKQKDIDKAKSEARKKFATKIREAEQAANDLKASQAAAKGDYKAAYDLLKKAGRVSKLELARWQWEAGEKDKAIAAVRAEIKSHRNEVLPQCTLVELLWKSGKKNESKKAFEDLRKISSSIDMNAPIFKRLDSIASELGLPKQWRLERKLAKDIGERPGLDSLGPFRWRPSPAPEWNLANKDGHLQSSKQFQGKPVLMIFYLGYGCLHCAEQLHAFSPKMKEFEEAGIELIAVSSDDIEGLKVSIENYDGGPLPIPLVADPKLDVFKAFRAHDDFENQALHGTFLIDADGMVRWQDIGFEPFMDPEFVLKEAKRLLAQPRQPLDVHVNASVSK